MNKELERKKLLSTKFRLPRRALFLDRDGVIMEDRHFVKDPEEVKLCKGAKELIHAAKAHELPVVVITNQSGISRGFFNWDCYEAVPDRLIELLGGSEYIAAIYANGYGPLTSANGWRKPGPGMLIQAEGDLNLDLNKSVLVGDRLSDLQSGVNAGVRCLVHVLTGHGSHERQKVRVWAREHLTLLLDSVSDIPESLLSERNNVYSTIDIKVRRKEV